MFSDKSIRWNKQVTDSSVSRGVVRKDLVVTLWIQIERTGHITKTYTVRGKTFIFNDVIAGIPMFTSNISLDDAMQKYERFQINPDLFYLAHENMGLQYVEEFTLDKTA